MFGRIGLPYVILSQKEAVQPCYTVFFMPLFTTR